MNLDLSQALALITGIVLIVLIVVLYIRSRQGRLITHPVLFALIVVIVTFLIEYLNRCI